MYCLGPFIVVLQCSQNFKYDVARRVSKPNMSAKFQGLVLFEKKKMKNFGAYRRVGIFYLTPFPCTNLHDFWVSGVF